jgi:predicted DNA-binding transcriptional regulator YafY
MRRAATVSQGELNALSPEFTGILDVARTLLANPDITVADVADRIGVSPATLYRYIPAARAANAPDV